MAFPYLSVLLSIIIGLGMSHVLSASVQAIGNRKRMRFYWPTLVWAANLFLLLLLVWWSSFNLNHHEQWNFPTYLTTIAIPALVYVMCGLILPASESSGDADMPLRYTENRAWFFSLFVATIALSFIQTYLLDGHITPNVDALLKVLIGLVGASAIFVRSNNFQKTVAVATFCWLTFFIALLFRTLRS